MLAPVILLALPISVADEVEFHWLDYNGDGLQDTYAFVPGGRHQLLENRGDGVFEEVTQACGLEDLAGALDAAWTDYDADGLPNLAILDESGGLHLWRTPNGVTFVEETEVLGLGDVHGMSALEWRDMDGDDLPELVLFGQDGIRVIGNTGFGVLVPPPSIPGVTSPDAADRASAWPAARARGAIVDRGDREGGADDELVVVDEPHTPQVGGKSKASLSPTCALGIVDTAGGPCLEASSNPTLGALYPLGDLPVLDPMGQGAAVLHAPDTNTVELELFGNRDLRLREGASYVTLGVGTGAGEGTLGALEVAGPLIASSLDTLEVQLTGTGGDVSLTSVEEAPGQVTLDVQAQAIALENAAAERAVITPVITLDQGGMSPFVTIEVNGRPLQGEGSTIAGAQATVAGGQGNQALFNKDTVGGGLGNMADSDLNGNTGYATVAGGFNNQACHDGAYVGGGRSNAADGQDAVVAGGSNNSIAGISSSSCIGGGQTNVIDEQSLSTIAGGHANTVLGSFGFIGGGSQNEITTNAGQYAVIAGGFTNQTLVGDGVTIGGGQLNDAQGSYSTIGGGDGNTTGAGWSTVAGGQTNTASGGSAAVGGGELNTAIGGWATVPGGLSNSADGNYSLAAGWDAHGNHNNCFVWSDGTSAPFASTGVDQYLIEASGGVGINTNNPGYDLEVNGDFCATVICTPSDARLKRDVRELSAALETVLALRGVTYEWDPDVVEDADPGRQLGFLAQEVREVVPEVVHEDRDGGLSVSYAALVPLLVEALRDQETRLRRIEEGLAERVFEATPTEASAR